MLRKDEVVILACKRPNMFSIRLRFLYRRLSYLMALPRDVRPGMKGVIPFSTLARRSRAKQTGAVAAIADAAFVCAYSKISSALHLKLPNRLLNKSIQTDLNLIVRRFKSEVTGRLLSHFSVGCKRLISMFPGFAKE